MIATMYARPDEVAGAAGEVSEVGRETYEKECQMPLDPTSRNVIRSYTSAVGTTAAVLVVGFLVGQALRAQVPIPAAAITVLQIAGACALLGATLGALDWRQGSWTGKTPAEQFDRWLFRALHLGGTFVLVTATAWSRVF
jgi:hypothetical protein